MFKQAQSASQSDAFELALQNTYQKIFDHMHKAFLVDLLSKKQVKIAYSTNQDMHLQNNIKQLVDGER